jgi:hypothetical protein
LRDKLEQSHGTVRKLREEIKFKDGEILEVMAWYDRQVEDRHKLDGEIRKQNLERARLEILQQQPPRSAPGRAARPNMRINRG